MLGCNGRPDARGRKTDISGIAGSPCSGAGRRILPAAAGLLSLWVATATQGRPHATAVVFVRNSGGSSATFFALSVCGDQPAHAHSCRRDNARSVHTRVRACHREDGVFTAVRPGQDAVVGIPAARRRSGGGDEPPPDPASGRLGWNSRRHRANPLRRRSKREQSHSSSTAVTCARFAVIRFARSR